VECAPELPANHFNSQGPLMPALLVALLAATPVLRSVEARTRGRDPRAPASTRRTSAPEPRRPRLRCADRLLWVPLPRLWPNWRVAIQIVTSETVVRWHRRGVRPLLVVESTTATGRPPGGGRRHPRADPADARGQPLLGAPRCPGGRASGLRPDRRGPARRRTASPLRTSRRLSDSARAVTPGPRICTGWLQFQRLYGVEMSPPASRRTLPRWRRSCC
jgi:hypothetical protein